MLMKFEPNKISQEEAIFFSKMNSKYSALSNAVKECMLCNKTINGYCNSHSVPQFCLKNLTDDGKLGYSNTILNQAGISLEKGISKAGVFFEICNQCDSTFFQDYENEENYLGEVSPQILKEIEVKNILRAYHARRQATFYMKNILDDVSIPLHKKHDVATFCYAEALSMKKSLSEFSNIMKAKSICDYYRIIYYEKLEYVVPFAFQDNVALKCDIEGNIVNNIYQNYENIQMLNLCIFPMKKFSILLVFTRNSNIKYRNFIKQLKKLTPEEVHKIILVIMFLYSDNFFYSKQIHKLLEENKIILKLLEITSHPMKQENNSIDRNYAIANIQKEVMSLFSLSPYKSIPDYLSDIYSLKRN